MLCFCLLQNNDARMPRCEVPQPPSTQVGQVIKPLCPVPVGLANTTVSLTGDTQM